MRFFAFLRAINVGGHTVKMDDLRRLFEKLNFSHVETFIASGNVVFESATKKAEILEKKIESRLREALGYEVATFLRTDAELASIAQHSPFSKSDIAAARSLNIAFLADPLSPGAAGKLIGLRSEIDNFHVNGREIYWLCLERQSQSNFSNMVLERTLGVRSTIRGVNTVQKWAAKYSLITP